MLLVASAALEQGDRPHPELTASGRARVEQALAKYFGHATLVPAVVELTGFAQWLRDQGHDEAGDGLMAVVLGAVHELRRLGPRAERLAEVIAARGRSLAAFRAEAPASYQPRTPPAPGTARGGQLARFQLETPAPKAPKRSG